MGINSNPGSCAPKYLLYIPTESECSRLINSKPDKAELEQILRNAHVLDRPGGGWRRVKRFFLVRGGNNGEANAASQVQSRVSSRTIGHEHDQVSVSEHTNISIDELDKNETTAPEKIKLSRRTSTKSEQLSPRLVSSLNPMAREFRPMVSTKASRSSESQHSILSDKMGSSKSSPITNSYAESFVSVSGSATCDDTPQEQTKAATPPHPTPSIPMGFSIPAPIFMPTALLPANLHMQKPPGWWEQLAQMYATFPPNAMGMLPYTLPVAAGMHIPAQIPAQFGAPMSAKVGITNDMPIVDSIPAVAPAVAPTAFTAPPTTPGVSTISVPPAPPPSVVGPDTSSAPNLHGMLEPVVPPPIPPPGNTNSQMQQDFEYYKYTYGKKNGLKRNNIRTWRGYNRH